MNTFKLNNGYEIPVIGLGTFLAPKEECYNACLWALKAGYRQIDTAQNYKNEEAVGRALKASGVKREDVFITSKLQISRYGKNNTKKAVLKSINDLGVDYIDLYLMHWPSQSYEMNLETYHALEEMVNEGYIRSIGVSNFQIHHLEHLLPYVKIKPVMNQIELHPGLSQNGVLKYCKENDILVTSYGPFMKGEALKMPLINELASKYHKTPAQICVRYLVDRGIVAIPKSVHEARIKENFDVFDFALTEDDVNQIINLNQGRRVYLDPDNRPGVPLVEAKEFPMEF